MTKFCFFPEGIYIYIYIHGALVLHLKWIWKETITVNWNLGNLSWPLPKRERERERERERSVWKRHEKFVRLPITSKASAKQQHFSVFKNHVKKWFNNCPNRAFLCTASVYISVYLPISPHEQDATQGHFKGNLTGLNSEFSFCLTSCFSNLKEPILPFYLSLAGGKIMRFKCRRVLALCEM